MSELAQGEGIIQQIAVLWTNIQNAIAGAERIFGILDEERVLGSVKVRLASVLCLDLSSVRAVDPNILGIVGGNVLKSSPYQINLSQK